MAIEEAFSVKPKLPVFVGSGIGAVKPVTQPDGEPQQPAPGKPPVTPPEPPTPHPPTTPPGGPDAPPHGPANPPTEPTDPGGGGGGGGGGAGGSGGTTPGPPVDWAQIYWGSLGLPPDLVAQLNKIFGQYPDQTVAFQVAQNYLRTTDWYAKTFPGIGFGIRNGLFTDEAGYRSYVNDLNNLYQQYQNRAVTGDEVASWLSQGKNQDWVSRVFKGSAIAGTEAPERQYEAGAFTSEGRLSDSELQAYGQEQAGIDTPLGQQITFRLQQAQQRLSRIFQGTLATPSLSQGPQGLFSPSLKGSSGNPDIGA